MAAFDPLASLGVMAWAVEIMAPVVGIGLAGSILVFLASLIRNGWKK